MEKVQQEREMRMKVRMLDGHLGPFFNDGAGNVMYDPKRGQIVDLPTDLAKRYVASGLVTAKHLKADLEDLPAPYVVTQESRSMEPFAAEWAARQVPPEARPLPEVVVVGRRPTPWSGWRA
jgi:hypothetical protein